VVIRKIEDKSVELSPDQESKHDDQPGADCDQADQCVQEGIGCWGHAEHYHALLA
jgi:hypothetical protein